MPYEADDSRWPLCFDLMHGEASDDDVAAYNRQRLARLEREDVHVQVINALEAQKMNAAQRKSIAEFNAEHREQQVAYLAGVAFTTSSLFIRGILTAIYWINPPAYPYKVFADLASAETWAEARLLEKQSAARDAS